MHQKKRRANNASFERARGAKNPSSRKMHGAKNPSSRKMRSIYPGSPWASLQVFLALSLPLIITACATVQNYQSTVNTWQGVSKKQLFSTWGLPDKEMQMPQGHNIYIYSYRRKASASTNVNTVGGQSYITRTNSNKNVKYVTCTTWFSVDKAGVIDNVRFQGDACEASDKFKKRYSAPD